MAGALHSPYRRTRLLAGQLESLHLTSGGYMRGFCRAYAKKKMMNKRPGAACKEGEKKRGNSEDFIVGSLAFARLPFDVRLERDPATYILVRGKGDD